MLVVHAAPRTAPKAKPSLIYDEIPPPIETYNVIDPIVPIETIHSTAPVHSVYTITPIHTVEPLIPITYTKYHPVHPIIL